MVVLTKNGTPLPHYLLLLVVAVVAIMFEQRERNHRKRSTAATSFSPPPSLVSLVSPESSLPRVAVGGGGVAFLISSFLGRGGVRTKMGWDVWALDTLGVGPGFHTRRDGPGFPNGRCMHGHI